MIKVKKIHPDAALPQLANQGDSGYDIIAISGPIITEEGYIQYHTGLAIEPPEGYHIEILPRSSIRKYDLIMCNSPGNCDGSYRGEYIVCFRPTMSAYDQSALGSFNRPTSCGKIYKKGDKIAQLMIRKTINMDFVEVDGLTETIRGDKGFGSSGA